MIKVSLINRAKCPVSFLNNMNLICIAEPAQIIERPKSVNATDGDPVTLDCTVAGTPELQVKWYKEGRQLMPSRYYTLVFEDNVSSLRIQSVTKEDSGEYTFKVENDFGSSSCTAYLDVLGLYCCYDIP